MDSIYGATLTFIFRRSLYPRVRVGEYLRYSSERYRRYRGLSIFILDTISKNQYLIGIFRYMAKQKIRFCIAPWYTCVYIASDVLEQNNLICRSI